MSFQDPQSQHIFYRKLWGEVGHFISHKSEEIWYILIFYSFKSVL